MTTGSQSERWTNKGQREEIVLAVYGYFKKKKTDLFN